MLVPDYSQANSGGTITADTLGFYVHDEVGSVIATVTENLGGSGQTMSLASYDTWGKQRPTTGANAYTDPAPGTYFSPTPVGQHEGYAGHEDMDPGLVDMEGRVYDPEVGMFLSADPNVQYPDSSQGYSRYTYVNDNPLSLSDPSGYFSLTGFLLTGDLTAGFFPQQYGQALGIAAPFLSIIPGCEGWCTAGAAAVGGYLSSDGDAKAAAYSVILTEVSGNFGPALRTADGAVNWTAVAYQVANSVAYQVDPNAAAVMVLIEGGYDAYNLPGSAGGLTGLRKYAEDQIVTYAARNVEAQIAERNGMSPFALDAELTVISIAGDYIVGSRYDPTHRHFEGYGNRDGLLGVPFDVVDTILAVQGLPTGSLYGQIADDSVSGTSGPVTGHSLGGFDANNSVALGFSSRATVDALPIFGSASAGVSANQGSNDAVTGFEIISRIFNPTENYHSLPDIYSWLPIGNHSETTYSCTFRNQGCPP